MRTYQVEMITVLETIEEPNDPFRAVGIPDERGTLEHIPLSAHMSLLAFTQHVRLPQLLHSVQLASTLLPDERNHSKGTMSDRLELDKRINIDPGPTLAQVLSFVLSPTFPYHRALSLAHSELFHLALHRQSALLARGLLTQDREVQIFEINAGRNGLFESWERRCDCSRAEWLDGSRTTRCPGVEGRIGRCLLILVVLLRYWKTGAYSLCRDWGTGPG